MKNVQRLETPSVNPRNNNSIEKMPTLPSTPPPPQENKMETSTPASDTPVTPSDIPGALSENPNLVPRKCNLRKWADYEGYGFNLHADKQNNLHFIGEVDEGSPAKLGGLRPGDRLVEVNGVNIDKVSLSAPFRSNTLFWWLFSTTTTKQFRSNDSFQQNFISKSLPSKCRLDHVTLKEPA